MNDILSFFDLPDRFDGPLASLSGQLIIPQSDEDLEGVKIILFHLSEKRWEAESSNQTDDSETQVFDHLSRMFASKEFSKDVAFLGRFINGDRENDTEIGLRSVFRFCLERKIIPIVIGNHFRLLQCAYEGFKEVEMIVNLTSISKRIRLGLNEEPELIGQIVKDQPNFLFNYTNIGYQTYYTNPEELALAESLYFDAYRLGEIRGDVSASEPLIRSSDLLHFELDSIKSSDFSSCLEPEPNGFYAEAACQMMRYAGLNERMRCVILSNYSPSNNDSDEKLIAQLIWCLIDGLTYRKTELPGKPADRFLRYSVSLKGDEYEIIFYKSLNTDRWWMEVPIPPNYVNKYVKHHMLPCSYEDYLTATNDEIPERWWRAYQKML